MQYAQNFRFGFFDISPKERLRGISEAGFSAIMQWWGDEFEETDGDKKQIAKYAREFGLKYSALHVPSGNSSDIWMAGAGGEEKFLQIEQVLQACNELECRSAVLHLTHKLNFCEKSELGIERFHKLAKRAEELGVFLAIENTRKLEYNQFVFDRVESKNIRACYDSGHDNCYTPEEDALGRFASKIVVTHLHDNMGRVAGEENLDLHNLMGDGTVDFLRVRREIEKLDLQYISLESYCNPHSVFYGMGMQEFLKLSHSKISALMERGVLL